MTKRMIIVIIALLIVFGGIFGWGLVRSYFMGQYFAHFEPPPETISTTTVKMEVWEPSIPTTGGLTAINGVQVSSEVPGMVVKIYFESGHMVQTGDPLVQLDDKTDQQDLKNFMAQLKLARINFKRQYQLYKTRSVAQSALDEARANLEEIEANTEKTKVLIDKKLIRAPFSGKIGIRQVNLGQYVNAGTALVTLQSLNPLYVQFSLPEQHLKSLRVGQPVQIIVVSHPKEIFKGKINAINAEINSNTRNILVQATVPNPKYILYPGMFANIVVELPQRENLITVPQTAITYTLYGDSVYVIKQEGTDKQNQPILKAHLQYVTVGERRDNEVAILKGLKVGDIIAISGQQKLQDGMRILINNSVDVNKSTSFGNS